MRSKPTIKIISWYPNAEKILFNSRIKLSLVLKLTVLFKDVHWLTKNYAASQAQLCSKANTANLSDSREKGNNILEQIVVNVTSEKKNQNCN